MEQLDQQIYVQIETDIEQLFLYWGVITIFHVSYNPGCNFAQRSLQ